MRGGGAPTDARYGVRATQNGCCHPPAPRARKRATDSPLTQNHLLRARSPLGAPPRLSPGFILTRLRARFPGTRPAAALPASRLSQSSGSTPRTGRNTGGHDARSRPGAACEAARRHRPHPAIRIASGMRPSWVRNYFLIADLRWESRKERKGATTEAVKPLK